jgi:SAM-dependent methyltransferase
MRYMVACAVPCNLCGSTDVEEVRSKDRHGGRLRSVICRRCGLVWTDPRLTPEEVRAFYAREYRVEYKGAYEPRARQQYRNSKTAQERLRRLQPLIEPGLRVLDVGAGSGEVVALLRQAGCDASGIEPNEPYARYAEQTRGLPVSCGFYQDAPVSPASLDLVTMFHTVEHLENPLEAMEKAAEWLRPEGALVIEVPNVEAVCQQPHQQFHRGHLYHFNLATLGALAARAGFAVMDRYTSPDGGNIAIVARKRERAGGRPTPLPGNYERVADILRRHTTLRHAFSRHPWIRPLRKIAARFDEYRHVLMKG